MAFHCMNCNGSMIFDVESQQLRCEHCGSTFDPQNAIVRDAAVVTTNITCRNCGAELEGTEDSLVGFCPYCGGQNLVSQPGSGFSAQKIIPFKVSRDQCTKAYIDYTSHIPYLHKDFKDPEHIKKFTGIYMPYYQYDATFGDSHIEGETAESHARYTEYTTYRVDVELEGDYLHGTPFDASKYLDDEISARCMPFAMEHEQEFSPAYLAGFYADSSTSDAELYYEDAKAQAEQDMISEIGDQVESSYNIPLKNKSRIETEICGYQSVLFPLWFLTWRKDDRVAYAVINGESGKVVSDLPINLKAFALGSVFISALLFALLELTVQPTPGITAFVSFIAAALMAWSIHKSAKRVYEVQTHAHDKGWSKKEGVNEKPIQRKGKMRKDILITAIFVLPPMLWGAFTVLRGRRSGSVFDIDRVFDAHSSPVMKAAPAIVLLIALFVLIRVIIWHKELKDINAPVAIGGLMVSVLINAAIIFVAPADDIWYYVGALVCIAGLIASSVAMLRLYNLSTTRPLPKLFDREEVS